MKDLKNIVEYFNIDGEVKSIAPLGDGLINDTYKVTTAGDTPDYVLQRINHTVFKDVEGMQRNIQNVTDHLRHKLKEVGEDGLDRKVLEFLKVKGDDKTFFFDGENYWRVSRFIPDSVTLSEVTTSTAHAAGKAFGRFQRLLSDLEKPLVETIPDFHNMEYRLRQLREAVENNPADRVREVKDLLLEIEKRAEKMTEPERMYREGRLPKRICHCDTKVNNMLFDTKGRVLCVIDLDTVMPSFVFSDFGDFLRTGAATAAEDEPDLDKIGFDMDIYASFAGGYLSEARDFLTEEEIKWLPDSVALFPYMQAVRFLTDYINGDTYYKISYPSHNLVRTRAQLRLLTEIESLMPQIRTALSI